MIRLARTDFGMQEGNGQDCIYCYVKDHLTEIAELNSVLITRGKILDRQEAEIARQKSAIAELIYALGNCWELDAENIRNLIDKHRGKA